MSISTKLPQPFVERMTVQLGEQFADFMKSYERSRFYGVRVNPLKIDAATFAATSPFSLRPVPWASGAFYYEEPDRPGRHPYYHAGLYYIQEPSAMAPAELLGVQPGDRVLDLCAAPGGKSTQLAAKLGGQGVLVSNDQSAERTRALVKNLELFGVPNAIVLNESPHRMSRAWAGFFDKILVDAPCSGEGMFRKDEDMWREWSEQSIEKCCAMQVDILRHAAKMLAPGGRMVYSTCTFAPEENERMMLRFLREHPEFQLVEPVRTEGFASGHVDLPDFTEEERLLAAKMVRLWPHLLEGEGHFVALLEKRIPLEDERKSEIADAGGRLGPQPASRPRASEQDDLYRFLQSHTQLDWRDKSFLLYGEHVYMNVADAPSLDGLKVVRPGFYLGMRKKNRFEPSHALALALKPAHVRCTLSFSLSDERLLRYLRCETLEIEAAELRWSAVDGEPFSLDGKYYVLVCVEGHSLGWGKWQRGVLKNEYPQTWRRLS